MWNARYIKEFVHGDFGRTQPNLGSIMEKETDILELDVEVTSPVLFVTKGWRDLFHLQ